MLAVVRRPWRWPPPSCSSGPVVARRVPAAPAASTTAGSTGPGTSCAATAPAPSTTSPSGRTSSSSSGATAWSPTACTAASAWSRPTRSGRVAEREEAWRAFRRFADEQGWTLGVPRRRRGVAARSTGPRACTTCTSATRRSSTAARFTLEGGRYKGLRQAVNRIAKYGYTITFHDPAGSTRTCGPQLEAVMTKSRRGDVERGFSMTLGRVFDPADPACCWPWCHGPDRRAPVAFCQYVPAAGIDGYSLDLMRRDDGDHPNGLHRLRGRGDHRATCASTGRRGPRPQLRHHAGGAGRRGRRGPDPAGPGLAAAPDVGLHADRVAVEVQRQVRPATGSPATPSTTRPSTSCPSAIAVARAESFWELPVIGRFLVPDDRLPDKPR